MQNMTIGDLVRKYSEERDREVRAAIEVIGYECGIPLMLRKPAEQITDSEVCGFEERSSHDMFDED